MVLLHPGVSPIVDVIRKQTRGELEGLNLEKQCLLSKVNTLNGRHIIYPKAKRILRFHVVGCKSWCTWKLPP